MQNRAVCQLLGEAHTCASRVQLKDCDIVDARYRCCSGQEGADHSTVTLFAKFRGLSTSVPRATAVWYESNCSGTTCRMGLSAP